MYDTQVTNRNALPVVCEDRLKVKESKCISTLKTFVYYALYICRQSVQIRFCHIRKIAGCSSRDVSLSHDVVIKSKRI
jgi:hypothetical protein